MKAAFTPPRGSRTPRPAIDRHRDRVPQYLAAAPLGRDQTVASRIIVVWSLRARRWRGGGLSHQFDCQHIPARNQLQPVNVAKRLLEDAHLGRGLAATLAPPQHGEPKSRLSANTGLVGDCPPELPGGVLRLISGLRAAWRSRQRPLPRSDTREPCGSGELRERPLRIV